MKAIILAAGYAVRLYPLTLDKPKALLPIAGKPVINYIIEKLESLKDIDKILIVTNKKFYINFIQWLNQNKNFKKEIKIINDGTISNETKLGGIGDLWFAVEEEDIKDNILVLNGDNLFNFSLVEICDYFKAKKKIVNAVHFVENKEEVKKHGVVEINDEKIVSFEEKPENPKTNLVSVGIYFFPKEMLKEIGVYLIKGNPKDAPGFLIKHFTETKEVYAFSVEGEIFDVGTKESYEKANELFLNNV